MPIPQGFQLIFFLGCPSKSAGFSVKDLSSILPANPEISGGIFVKDAHIRLGGVVHITRRLVGIHVKPIQSA